MIRLKNEVKSLVNRGRDRHIRLAVTGLSRSGKTAFITAFVNQLLNVNSGARLPLFSAAREGRLYGVKRIPQKDFGVPRFSYDEGIASLYGDPPAWPTPTRGIGEIQLALRYRPTDSFIRHFTERASLYLEIIDYPGEWLLDLPMLEQDYKTWSENMANLLKGDRAQWAKKWLDLVEQCDPLAPANETQLADISDAYTEYLTHCKKKGLHFIQPGRFVLPGDLFGAPVLQFFPWPKRHQLNESALEKADARSNIGMLKARYSYYCQNIVKGFYNDYFSRFDRQIVLIDCLQPLNNGLQTFNDMQAALNELMKSFHYGQRTLLRRLFSPRIDKLMFAATKADHITSDQHANLVSLLQQLIKEAKGQVEFEGINIDCVALASVQATQSGFIEKNGQTVPTVKGNRLNDGEPLIVYPGAVPSHLPSKEFWQSQGFSFDEFRPQAMQVDTPLPHIRLDTVMEFLIGDKLK